MFLNRKVKWWLNVTTQHVSGSNRTFVLEVCAYFFPTLSTVTVYGFEILHD
jgi:hypothetical protein